MYIYNIFNKSDIVINRFEYRKLRKVAIRGANIIRLRSKSIGAEHYVYQSARNIIFLEWNRKRHETALDYASQPDLWTVIVKL